MSPIVRVEVDLLNDNEPAQVYLYGTGLGFDGRYTYGTFWKPVRNGGPFPLSIRATDVTGAFGEVVCSPGVAVTSPGGN
jgi:hypothetical protein